MKFACGEPGTSILGGGRNCVPSIPQVAYSTFCSPPPENIRVFVDILDYGVPLPKVTWVEEFYEHVIPQQIDLLFLGRQSVEDTIKKIVVEGNKYVTRP